MADYNIFMAMVEKVGHDKRGNTIFKRDNEGNEILIPDLIGSLTANGDNTTLKKKVEDDQTVEVPSIFAKWKVQEGIKW